MPLHLPGSLALAGILAVSPLAAQRGTPPPRPFPVVETTIAEIHTALRTGHLTCHALVDSYLRRIDAYDKRGPAINSLILVNPDALKVADSLDRAGFRNPAPLACIPMIVKDNYQTRGLQTTGGSLAFKGFVPDHDAFVVARLRAAGAIVLAKSNMAELAFSPYETVSSILPGYTRNPYELDRVTAGSSGGTAAAVSANLGESGLGTDTGNSIRGPSSHLSLVGIRPTMGLTSRSGVIPLLLDADVTGPMARTVADAVTVLQVIAGADPADSATAASEGHVNSDYAAALVKNGLKGARIGVLHQAYDTPTLDPEVKQVFLAALDDLRKAGAEIIDSVSVDSLTELRRGGGGGCHSFKYDFNRYLATLGPSVPIHSLDELVRSRRFHPSIQLSLTNAQRDTVPPETTAGCTANLAMRARVRAGVLKLLDTRHLDALVYPTWSNAPRLIGDLNTPAGDNNQFFSPTTGFPAITVPMGWLHDATLPAGLQFFGRPWDEATLIRLAYSYEQATHHRHPPGTAPALRAAPAPTRSR